LRPRSHQQDCDADRAVDLTKPGMPSPLSTAERELYTRGTDFIPVDGIVKETSTRLLAAARPTSTRRARSTSGSSTTPSAPPRFAAAVSAMLSRCCDPAISAANAPISTRFMLAWHVQRDCRRAISMESGWHRRASATRALAPTQPASAKRSIVGRKFILPVSVGSPSIPPTCARSCSKNHRAHLSLDDAKVVAARSTLFGAWEGNWLAYNFAHDVALPGSTGPQSRFPDVPASRDRR
jgi:hypothetical protein